jgi:cobalt/nickel transport system permease protein
MSDALITPIVGGTLWGVSGSAISYSTRKIQNELEDNNIPLMGVMGAFVFAAQMVNFTIPMTGSSGHIGGGVLLSIILGPFAGFLAMATVLIIQALFFADGGLLALGANIFNLGFMTCFVAYPLIYMKMTRRSKSIKRISAAAFITSVIGLQLGSLGVVAETFLSGKTELPIGTLLMFMQPIHLAIGVVEGLITVAVISFIFSNKPEIIMKSKESDNSGSKGLSKLIVFLLILTVFTGGFLAIYASENPDGLEWAVMRTSSEEELTVNEHIHELLATIQEETSVLPDYDFKNASQQGDLNTGTSVSGIVGGALILAIITIVGYTLRFMRLRKE